MPEMAIRESGLIKNAILQNKPIINGKKSDLYFGPIGGLMHGANAVGTKSVIVITPYQHPTMACYPNNINIRIGCIS